MEKDKIPKISYVLPTWNGGFVINQTIDSIFEQTIDDWELIIVDDGSTDNTQEIVNQITDKRIKYVRLRNRMGAGNARNFGNNLAVAPFISVTDCGDIYYADRYNEILEFFENNNNIDILCTAVDYLAGGKSNEPRVYTSQEGEKLAFEHPGVVYRKVVTESIKYRDTSIHTDQYDAFFFDCGLANFKFGVLNKALSAKCTFNEYQGGRNLSEALLVKIGIYREYNKPIPEWLLKHENEYLQKRRNV